MSLSPSLRQDKRASQIARLIEADIIRRGWPLGVSLGSETTLQERYHVSRSVLREAVRLVEHHRVARMRRGPNGGLVICEPDAQPAARAIVIYLEYVGISIGDLLDARLLLEPLAASLAADSVDEAGIERLRAVLRAEQDGVANIDDFHLALAEQSRNPVLRLLIDILMRLTVRYARGSRHISGAERSEAIARRHEDHAAIVAAVTAGDAARAMTLSEQHAAATTRWLQQRHRSGRSPRVKTIGPQGKRAETVAAAIRADIADRGWPVGEVVGTELALLERYRVSRSVLREAVRLLEYHAVVTTRPGPGGGLVVSQPRAQASIDTIAMYLQYRRPSRADLTIVRDAIEIDAVAKVVARRDDPDVRAFLDGQRRSTGQPTDLRDADVEEFVFHTGLAQLAGNPVLDLFLQILIEVLRRHWAGTDQPVPSRADLTDIRHAHQRIIDAVEHGDDGLARHRVRRHLDAAASWWR